MKLIAIALGLLCLVQGLVAQSCVWVYTCDIPNPAWEFSTVNFGNCATSGYIGNIQGSAAINIPPPPSACGYTRTIPLDMPPPRIWGFVANTELTGCVCVQNDYSCACSEEQMKGNYTVEQLYNKFHKDLLDQPVVTDYAPVLPNQIEKPRPIEVTTPIIDAPKPVEDPKVQSGCFAPGMHTVSTTTILRVDQYCATAGIDTIDAGSHFSLTTSDENCGCCYGYSYEAAAWGWMYCKDLE